MKEAVDLLSKQLPSSNSKFELICEGLAENTDHTPQQVAKMDEVSHLLNLESSERVSDRHKQIIKDHIIKMFQRYKNHD